MDFVYLELGKALARENVRRAEHRPDVRSERRPARAGRRAGLARWVRRPAVSGY